MRPHATPAAIRLTALLIACATAVCARAQTVGIVMSGGAAKGMTHIGVIKALEENGIPIDYVAGTSMGAIVAGLYANGMTVDEMIGIIKSDDFHRWQTGEIEPHNRYYFRQDEPAPDLYSITLSERDDKKRFKANILPNALVNPGKMNIALLELFTEANAVCRGDFDRLFVPFRSVASDIGGQGAYVWRMGDFGDAVRSSMSYPVMFRPVTTPDGHVLIDGGIFNNFPADVMKEDFHPGYIIGSSVSGNMDEADERDLMNIAQNLVIRPTDYHIEPQEGIVLQFTWDKINIWDFSIVDQLVQQGYDSTMARMDEIKAAVSRRVSADEVDMRRQRFNDRKPRILFKRVMINGVSENQRLNIERSIHRDGEVFDLRQMRERYYKLLSDNAIKEIIPHAYLNPLTGYYDLVLDIRTEDRLKIMAGGHLSTTVANQIYLGARYQTLGRVELTTGLDAQLGQFYNCLNLSARLDFARQIYLKGEINVHGFKYRDNSAALIDNLNNDFVSDVRINEFYTRACIGLPASMRNRWEFGISYGITTDRYTTLRSIMDDGQRLWSRHSMSDIFWRMYSNSLNQRSYATDGHRWYISAHLTGGTSSYRELYQQTETGIIRREQTDSRSLWAHLFGEYEGYWQPARHFIIGFQAEAFYSFRPLLHNYTSNMLQTQRFAPTPHSKATFNTSFAANQYVAAGLKPIWRINNIFHLRFESYVFSPVKAIRQVAKAHPESGLTPLFYEPEYASKAFDEFNLINELTFVADFKLITLGAFVNCYDYAYDRQSGGNVSRSTRRSDWNAGINLGILLFKDRMMR